MILTKPAQRLLKSLIDGRSLVSMPSGDYADRQDHVVWSGYLVSRLIDWQYLTVTGVDYSGVYTKEVVKLA